MVDARNKNTDWGMTRHGMPASSGVPGSICGVFTEFHAENVGSQYEFFDDHQRWMIESFYLPREIM